MSTNGVGQRTRMDDGSGFTTWSYDNRGRVTEVYQSVTGGGNFRTQWSYNSADLPVWMRYPLDNGGNLGETVNFTYNTQMLLDRVYGTDTYVDDTWYDAAGRVTLRELGNNYTLGQTYTYYPWTQQGGRLQNLKSGIALDTDSLQSLSYVYDDVGNVQSITDYNAGGTQTQTFTYDDLDRLSSAVASGGTGGTYALKDYDYDTQGRLEINGTVTNYYENTAHIHAVSKTSTGNTYSYDQNGNQTSRKVGGITYTLIYDPENRLVQIKRGSNIQATYTYDGDGNRVKTVVGSTTTTYIGNYLERECINSVCAMKSYYYAAGQRVALRQGSSTLYFLLTDHLGSTAVTATSGGGFSAEMRYYPWGGTRYTYGTTPTSYRYTGQREAEVGLYYYGARFYDPALGRFVQADSIIPKPGMTVTWDRYAYTGNNPVKYIDPSGHMLCEEMPWEEDCVNTPEQLYRGYQARGVPLRFSRLPVDINKFSWLQWFGATDFAYSDHKNFVAGRDNYNYDGYCQGMHCGIDLGANWGDSVYAGIYGKVVNRYNSGSDGGWSVTVQYGDYQVFYQHLSSVAVGLGDIVSPDTLIGGIGNPTGNENNGNYHLHMEVRHDADNDAGGWAELVENPLDFMSAQQIQALQVRADEFIGGSPNNYDPLLSFSYWYTKDIFSQPNPIHIGGPVLWR